MPDETSVYAAEGTAAHMFAEAILRPVTEGKVPGPVKEALGTIYNGYGVDEEMAQHVGGYARRVLEDLDFNDVLMVEVGLDMSWLRPGEHGTSDAVNIKLAERNVKVRDLKYGRGVQVAAMDNDQGYAYAAGVLHTFDYLLDGLIDTVTVVIDQPRRNHLDEWTITVQELRDWMAKTKAAVARCEEPDAPFVPGEAQCKFCKAKATCAARAEAVREIISGEPVQFLDLTADHLSTPEQMTDDHLAALLPQMQFIQDWVVAVKHAAEQRALQGHAIAHHKLVQATTHRKFTDEGAVKERLKRMRFKVDQYAPRKLASPAQIQTLVGGDKWPRLEDLVTKPEGKLVLVPEDDKRPAVQPPVFENLEEHAA